MDLFKTILGVSDIFRFLGATRGNANNMLSCRVSDLWPIYIGERLFWYDDFRHPNDPTLASTYPHHKHVPPDIRHHRIPAPGLSFTSPNLPGLLQEIEGIA
jgi:hypothetical protein